MRAGLAPWRRGPLTDGATVGLALACVGGARWGAPVPVVLAVAAVVPAALSRRAVLVMVAAGLLAAGLAHQAHAGLSPPEAGPFTGPATLVSDPEPSFGGWRVDVRTSLGRLELEARGGAGGRLSSRQAGERITVEGRVGALGDPSWAVPRHVRGRLVASRVEHLDDGSLPVRLVNAVRDLVIDGARSIPEGPRALFLGFVLGDDRGGSLVVADDFEGAGLSHLLVVSGQNVVFVLAVAAPLVSRLGIRGRLVATVALLLLFAAITRFEPSVLRATAMAGLGAVGAALGRPVAGVRVLALAVAGLVLLDPLLVWSMGFLLSVAASAGIVLLAAPVAAALPGPAPLRAALAVTLAAQVAVAPLLVPAFGPMPLAAVPANLAAEPVAGALMMWGCTAGLAAGLLPAPLAALVHLPTRLGLWWVAEVARVSAHAPLGRVGLVGVVVLGGAVALAATPRRRRPRLRLLGRGAALVVVVVVVVAAGSARSLPPGGLDIGGAALWRGASARPATVLLVPGDARPASVLEGLRTRGVRHLDLIVVRSPGRQAAETVDAVRQRVAVDVVWVPPGAAAPGTAPVSGEVRAGGLRLDVRRRAEGLEVDVELDDLPAPPAGSSAGGAGAGAG